MNLMYNLNKQGKIDFFCRQSKDVIVPWAQSPQQFFLRYYPWLIWPTWVCAAEQAMIYRVVTISPFKVLNKMSVWAVKVDE